MVLDDLHHANESELWILDQLARRPDLGGATFIGGSRVPLDGEAGRSAIAVDLPPLTVDEVRDLLADTGRTMDATDFHDSSGGNPLFVHAALRNPGVGANPLTSLIDAPNRLVASLVAALALSTDAPLPVITHALGEDSASLHKSVNTLAVSFDSFREDTRGEIQPRPRCSGQPQNQSTYWCRSIRTARLREVAGNHASSLPAPSGACAERHLTPRSPVCFTSTPIG